MSSMASKKITDGSCLTSEIEIDCMNKAATFKLPDEEFSKAHLLLRKLIAPLDYLGHHLGVAQWSARIVEFYGYSWAEEYPSPAIGKKLTIGPFHNVLLEYEAYGSVGDMLTRIHIRPQYSNKRVNYWRTRKRVKCWWADFYFKGKPKDGKLKVKFI